MKKTKVKILTPLLLAAVFCTGLWTLCGCQKPTRQFDSWRWKWPTLSGQKDVQPANSASDQKNTDSTEVPAVGNCFDVRILVNRGTDDDLRTAWSYLDEASPLSKDWQMLHRNGLRCGIGQYSDWTTVKDQLEKGGTKVKSQFQIVLNTFASMKILNDELQQERTLFYYDRDGQVHGRDFGPSTMQMTMTVGGRVPGGRMRTVLTPRIFQETLMVGRLVGDQNDSKKSLVEQELENFSIFVDLGQEEFALIGPSRQDMPSSLVGAQLFLNQKQGQLQSYFILISPIRPDAKGK
jgi:hypothetical protein